MLLAWDNKWDGAALTVGSEIAALPGTNTKTPHLSQKWYTVAAVNSSFQVGDLGAPTSCSILALLGSNLTSAAVARLRASNTDATGQTATILDTGNFSNVKLGYGAVYKHVRGQYPTLPGYVPSLALDAMNGVVAVFGTNAAGLTVTRAGATATRFNEKGGLEVVPADTPRVMFDPVTHQCLGIAIEPARTNRCLWNSDFTNAAWGTGDAANPKLPNSPDVAALDGTFTACGFVLNSIAGNRGFGHDTGFAPLAGRTDVLSFYVWVPSTNSANPFRAYMFAGGDVPGDPIDLNALPRDQWVLARYAHTWSGAASLTITIQLHGNFPDTVGDRAYYLLPQLEIGAVFPTSRIITAGAAVTRNADVPAFASIAGWGDQAAECTVAVEFSLLCKTTENSGQIQVVFELSDDTDNERYGFYAGKGGTDTFSQYVVDGGVLVADTSAGAVTSGVVHRAAMAFRLNDCAVSLNGAAASVDNAVTMATVTKLYLGSSHGIATRELMGYIRRVSFYNRRLTNAQLATLSSAPTYVEFEPKARYWRIDVADATLNQLQVGRVVLAPSWKHSQTLVYPWAATPVDPSIVTKSRGGQSFPDAVPKYRALDFMLDFLRESEIYENPFAMARANGAVKDVLAIPFESGSYISEQAVWGLVKSVQEPVVHRLTNCFRQKFRIEERL